MEQSRRSKGLPSLFSAHLYVELLLGPSDKEVQKILNRGGSGRPLQQIKMNVKFSSLICPNEDDTDSSFCLFLAITLTAEHKKIQAIENMRERKLHQTEFSKLVNSPKDAYKTKRNKLCMDLLNSINKCGIILPTNLSKYNVQEHIPLIQKYFDEYAEDNEKCRIVVYGEYGTLKPIFKGMKRWRWDVPICYFNNHFCGIRNLNTFFGVSKNYCIDCESKQNHFYQNKRHKI